MDQNTAAINAVKEYAKIKKPGYALMIEAPWGAGKTYLVNRAFKDDLSNDNARYVTLNGVSDRMEFRRALLADTPVAKLTDAAGKIGDIFGKMSKLGDVGSILQDVLEDRMIDNLPNLLIFDDVERCEMSPGETLGMINDFVEHKAKNVILCAFVERLDQNEEDKKRDEFLFRKEKVVGRTVKIVADVHNALPRFIATMPSGQGQDWFKLNDKLVIEIFSVETHNNLRVLRQCLHDCGRVIDVLDEDILGSTDAMIRFVRTYLVLSMALADGDINSTHLSDRSDYSCISPPAKDEKPHPLHNCFKQHPHAEIFAGTASSILPVNLGDSLIGIGYEEHDKINRALRATGQFTGEQEIPLWRRFVEWRKMTKTELNSTYEEAYCYIFKNEDIEPGPYLHVVNDLVSIAKDGFGNEHEIAKKIEDRIQTLKGNNEIPAATYGKEYGWNTDMGTFSFGGYGFEPNSLTLPLIESMRCAQISAFIDSRPKEAKRLLGLLKDDLEAFGCEFLSESSNASYFATEILHEIDPNEFAKVIIGYIASGDFEPIGTQLKTLSDRNLQGSMPEELAWANIVKTSLIDLAEQSGELEKARMVWFLELKWKFPAEDEVEA